MPKLFVSISIWGILGLASVQATSGAWPYQTFRTESFEPPVLDINRTGAELAEGFFVFTPQGPRQNSPVIMTDCGDLVWSGPNVSSANLVVQSLNGTPVLSFWQAPAVVDEVTPFTYGNVSILDDTYTEIYNICPDLNLIAPDGSPSGCSLNAHESLITPRGTILVTVVNITTADLTSVGGPAVGWVNDDMFLEIDIATMEILFKWRALDHVPINTTKAILTGTDGLSRSNPFDWFHMNSVDVLGEGYLTNSRTTWSSYAINSTGGIDWILEGSTGGDFSLPSAAEFAWQHDARVYNVTPSSLVLSLFNNFNSQTPTYPSRGLLLYLDLDNHVVKLIGAYEDIEDQTYSISQGDFTQLENNNWFVDYGDVPQMKEFGSAGDVRMIVQFGDLPVQNSLKNFSNSTVYEMSYRAYKQGWEATPGVYGPAVTIANSKGYVSWNGDTRTTQWIIFAGKSISSLQEVATVNRTGFETSFSIPEDEAIIQVGAVADEIILRNSSVIKIWE
ncbi:conserved hypothetical protein [Talaromyces stipitatus ATCC 10500]|uniref:ASST-domain-containing protein n=1 Tax=Talaromyces stipitatus (strain ATCC 10500 / CBS 375.48 / QM 6759 / NRRL 1006) TaxID=441959 RepID=B8MCL1_TALSN|nr:uncharacterized protein TSTA_125410 [Talaromyces stipitatus ATCC 10500]EED18827.1 conserved hypothetical protein [Talaromyces stipitatus ATCC 10500]